jgi:hypothetical protein
MSLLELKLKLKLILEKMVQIIVMCHGTCVKMKVAVLLKERRSFHRRLSINAAETKLI